MRRRNVIFIGSLLFAVSLYLIATSPLFGLADSSYVILTGCLLLGFSSAMVTVPLIPEVLDSIEDQFPQLEGEELNNVISGYFNSCLGIGEVLGPVSSGILVESYGFRVANDMTATLVLIFCIIFILVNSNTCTSNKQKVSSEDSDEDFIRCDETSIDDKFYKR